MFAQVNGSLWGKKSDFSGTLRWLSLRQHLKDSKDIAGLLWEHWLSEGQKKIIQEGSQLEALEECKSLVQFLAAIHDIGKATPAFQYKKFFNESPSLHRELMDKLEFEGFRGINYLNLTSPHRSHHSLAGQCILSWLGARDDIASIVGAHHGKPIDSKLSYTDQKSYKANYYQVENPHDPIYQKWKHTQEAILHWALKENSFETIHQLPEINQATQVLLSGLIIMADWIASNENYFPLLPLEYIEAEDQSVRVESAWSLWEKTQLWETKEDPDIHSLYERRFDFAPRNVQSVFSHIIAATNKPGVFILEAPMGLGKTEAALIGVEQLAAKTQRAGTFFGLPTQATSNGMFPRVKEWLTSIANENFEPLPLRLSHGKASLNESFQSLAQQINRDEGIHENIIVNEWFSGRKTSALDDFVIGTVDQFLLVALKQKHLALRHLGFSKKVVVIDEVHAYDAYMSQYLSKALLWMGAYDVPVIILSATLPADKREQLMKSYMRGKGLTWRNVQKPEKSLATDSYPLITYCDGNQVKQEKKFDAIDQKTIAIFSLKEENLLEKIGYLYEKTGAIGIILNTVKRAQELANTCAEHFGADNVFLLHSRFIAKARAEKELDLLSMIGKNGQRPKAKIIIGTQVMEQSLDIDFDVLITDLAPIDLLIQRLGRLHRHTIHRPEAHQTPCLYVLGTNEEFQFEKGAKAIYGDYLLLRTQVLLPQEITLPDDISPLVQQVYSESDIKLNDEYEDFYKKSQKKNNERIKNKERRAKAYRIGKPVTKEAPFKETSLIGWLTDTHPDQSEEFAHAQVRDIQDTIEVIALKKQGVGYSFFGTSEDLSLHIRDSQVTKEIANHTLLLPLSLSSPSHIDKTIKELEEYNLKHLSEWQESAWLKGSLGIIFDENHQFSLNGFLLEYDERYGLTYQRM